MCLRAIPNGDIQKHGGDTDAEEGGGRGSEGGGGGKDGGGARGVGEEAAVFTREKIARGGAG